MSRARSAALLSLAMLLIAATGTASAAPVTYSHPSGASVTLSSDTYAPGGRVQIEGSGFTPAGGQGNPILAIKPDLLDDEDTIARKWHAGGPSALPPEDLGGGEWVLQFQIALNGQFSGWIDLPTDLALVGPAGSPHQGDHFFQLLCGLLSTGTNPCAVPVSFQAFFGVADLQLGQVSTSGSSSGTFYAGQTFPPGAGMAVRGSGLPASTAVAITLDGQPYSATSFSTTAAGTLPPTASITVPADAAPGTHTAQLTIGAQAVPLAFTVVPKPTAVVLTPSVPAGGTLAMRLENWRNIGGTGQKVGLKLGSPGADTLACVQTDAAGNADVSVTVPAATAAGMATVFLLAGTNCVAGGEQSDLPARVFAPQPTFTVTVAQVPPPGDTTTPPPGDTTPPPPPGDTSPPAPPVQTAVVSPRYKSAKLAGKGRQLRLTLTTGTASAARRTTVTVKSSRKVRVGGKRSKAKTVTLTRALTFSLAPSTTSSTRTVTLTLTAEGRKALRRLGRLSVVVRIAPAGGKATTKTLILKA